MDNCNELDFKMCEAYRKLLELTKEQRLEVLRMFCVMCGSDESTNCACVRAMHEH